MVGIIPTPTVACNNIEKAFAGPIMSDNSRSTASREDREGDIDGKMAMGIDRSALAHADLNPVTMYLLVLATQTVEEQVDEGRVRSRRRARCRPQGWTKATKA